ncbi:MAG: HYR domain-containing protein, partial [Flavobacteriaceae bacterium]|nr:HYR domain-containing protein [Flavobacteriaceae bacterium]
MKKQLLTSSNLKNINNKLMSFLLIIGLFFISTPIQKVYAQDSVLQLVGGDSSISICDGESVTLEVIIGSSISPYTIIYSDGSTNYTVNNYTSDADPESPTYGGDPITVSPSVTTTYSLVSVTDQYSTSLPISSSTVTITVNPLPSNIVATVNAGNPVCYGTVFEISATATNGNGYELWNAANTAKLADLPYNATITADTNYNVRAISSFGCISSAPLTVELENTPPTISGEGNKILNPLAGTCSVLLPDYTSTVVVSDDCSPVGNITLTQNPVAGSTVSNHNTVQPVQVIATDQAGNQSTYNFNVTLIDTIAPEITCVGDQIDVPANSGCSYVHSGVAWNAVATDNCSVTTVSYELSGATSGSGTTLNGVTFFAGVTTVTWTVTDVAGLTASCSFDVSISDSEAPTVSCVANQTRNTSSGCTYIHVGTSWDASASDNCGAPSISFVLSGDTTGNISSTLDGAVFNKGVTTVTVTASDTALNSDTCSFTVTINDNEDPVIVNLPSNISVNNDIDSCGAVITWTEPTATDNCSGGSIVQTAGLANGSTFPIGVSTVTYTASDDSGNETIASFTITVNDNQNPEIACPSNISQNVVAGTCGAVVTYTAPVGTDNCIGSVTTQIGGLASGSTFPVGVTTNTFQVEDASGNTTSCSFTVTIIDNEIPVIVGCPSDIVQSNDTNSCGAIVTWTEPTATDNCTPSGSISWTKSHIPGSLFPKGTTLVTYVARDASNNVSATCSFNVTINDTQLPVIVACPANITKSTDLGSCEATVSWTEPSANDNCTSPANLIWQKSHTPGSVFAPGTTTVTYTAEDEAGNVSLVCSFNVTVVDNRKPVISNCPSSIILSTDADSCFATVTWTEPTATDNCTTQGDLVWTKSHSPGDTFNVGTTTVTYTATDANLNVSNACTFDVIVSDTQLPTAICTSPTLSLNASGVATLTVADVNNGSSDNCTPSNSLIITLSKTSFNCTNVGENLVTMSVKDASGNTSTCIATVTVVDPFAPTLTATAGTVDSNLNTDIGVCYYQVKGSEFDPIASDNCTSGVTLSYTITGATTLSGTGSLAGKNLLQGANVITWTASDASNTSTPLVFTKTVIDNRAPSLLTVGNQNKGTTTGLCGYLVSGTEFDATYSDNCSITSVTYTINGGTPVAASTLDGVLLAPGINTVVWTVSDGTNSKSATFRVTVTDTTLPIITSISNITQEISTGCDAVVTWTEPTASDNCAITSFSQTAGLASGSTFPVGTTKVTYTAVDASGNIAKMSFDVSVVDLTPPVLTCPTGSSEVAPFERDADLGICFYTVQGTEFDVTTTDGCAFTAATNSFDGSTTLEGKQLPVGDNTITWTAVDQFNNTSSCTIYVRVFDTQSPTFDQPTGNPALSYNYNRNANPAQCFYTITDTFFDLRNIDDNCDLQDATYVITKNGSEVFTGTGTLSGVQLPTDEVYPYSIVWTVQDVNGNTVVADAFTITVTDNQAPTFECYGNEIRNIPGSACNYTIVGTEFDPKLLSDNCDASGSLTISYTLDSVSGGASTSLAGVVLAAGVHNVVWTITDTKGNAATCSFKITVKDSVLPTISAVLNQTRNAPSTSCSYVAVGTEFDPLTVTDNCPTYTLVNNQSGTATLAGFEFPVGITVVVWTVTDAGGNVATMQYQVEVLDVTAPDYELIADANSTVSVTKSTSSTSCLYTVSGTEFDPHAITDNCTANNYTVLNDYNNYRSLAFEQFPVGTTTVNWSVKDNYGNETIKTLEITVVDDVSPVISCPSGAYTRVYGQGQNYYAVGNNEFKPIVYDNCGISSYTYSLSGATTGSGTNLTGVQLNEGVNTIVWTATDTATPANTQTCSITVNVVSDLYPAITCVGDQSKSTDTGFCTYTVSGTEFNATSSTAGATLINNFNNSSTLAGAIFPQGTTLVTWTASQTVDGTVYTNDCNFYVFVNDNEDPVITAPANVTVNTNSGCYATSVNLGSPITSDNCSGVINVWNNQGDSSFYLGTTTVTWYAEDAHGNVVSDTQTVTVIDDDAPTFNCMASICREVDEGQNYYTVFDHEFNPYNVYDCSTVTTTNSLNGASTLAGYQFPLGVTNVTWTFTDANNNISTCTTIVTINSNDPPSVTCRGNQTRTTDSDVCTYTISGNELDVTSTTPGTTLTYELTGATTASGSTTLDSVVLNKGITTVTWTATNGTDSNVCCTYDIYVYDNQNPVVSWPADITVSVDTGSCNATNVIVGTPTATDNCDNPIDITYTKSTNTTTFGLGVTNLYWTARDTRGNYVSHTQVITVTDDIAPVIVCPLTTYYREYSNPYVNYYYINGDEFTPSVSDNCSVASYTNSITNTRYINGQHLLLGNHIITWTATDNNPGTPNTATCNVNVTIVDSFDPIISCPASVSQNSDSGACSYIVPEGITAYDATFVSVSGDNRTMTHDLAGAPSNTTLEGATIPAGINTITWTATQEIGGVEYTNSCSFTFTVLDRQAPVLDLPFDDVTVNVDPGTCTNTFTLTPPTATDNCSALENITIVSNAPATFLLGTTNVRWQLTDEAGNTTVYNQQVTVYDNEPPVITNCPATDLTAQATGSLCQVVVSWPALIATDACSGVKSFTSTHSPGTLFGVGTTTVTYTATDNNDNVSTCSFDVVVTDALPTIACVEDQTRSADSGTCSYKVFGNEFDPTVYDDNCETPSITWSFIHPETLEVVTGSNTLSGVSIPRGSNNGPTTGQITITWTATDSNSQTATCTFVLTITDDEPPILTVPGNQTRSTDLNQNYYTVNGGEFDDVTATDNCGIVTKIVNEFNIPSLDGLQLQIGENTILWEATDDSGNVGSATFYAYIEDTELPRLENAPTGISADVVGCTAVVNYTVPTFLDNVTSQGNLIVTISPTYAVSGYEFSVGITPVTYIVSDEAGNVFNYSFDVTVTDNIDPTLVCPSGDSGNQFNRNTDTGEAFYTTSGTEFDPTSFSDNCLATLENNYNNSDTLLGETFPIGTTDVVWTVTDDSGNSTSCTIQVIVTDIEDPVINSCAYATVSRDADVGSCFFTVTSSEFDPYDFNDNAGILKLTYSLNGGAEVGTDVNTTLVGAQIPAGTIANPTTTVLWRLYDLSNNVSATCETVFTISDVEVPQIPTIATQTRNLSAGLGTYTANVTTDAAWDLAISDNCTLETITYQIDGGDVVGTDTNTSIIGESFTVGTHTVLWQATDIYGNANSGSYQVIIVDNEPPTAVCNNITVELDNTGSYSLTSTDIDDITLGSNDPSGIATTEVSPNSFDCVDVGANTVTVTLTDNYGNISSCEATVTVEDNTPPTALCKPVTLYIDESGSATITAASINNSSSDICGIASISASKTVFDCNDFGDNTVTLTVTDVNGNTSTCDTTVTVLDDVAPVAVCKNIVVSLDVSGNATISGLDIDNGSYDNCLSNTLIRTATPSIFNCTNIGENEVTLTVADPAGNSDTCTAIVTVIDNLSPTVVCQNITLQLDATGNATISVNDIDNGSFDACGLLSMTISKTDFNCSNIGSNPATNTVTLTATDLYGNSASCSALVTVEDNVAPTITCTTDQVVSTDNNACSYTHGNITWDATANDACGAVASLTYSLSGATVLADAPANTSLNNQEFNPGITTVTWTAIDANSNTSQCSYTVTVNDTQLPNAICQNITVQLDASGNASIVAADIDNGSNDNCGIQSIVASKTNFTCADFGSNTVTLTVTDTSNNVSTCDATVTVQDNIDPVAVCTPITVQLNASGTYTLIASDIDAISAGSSDNCSIVTREVFPNTFTCANIGTPVNVTLTVTDIDNNTDTCTTTITVEDNLPPTTICKDIVVPLNALGNATITANDIDNNSTDNCAIATRVASKTAFTCADLGLNIVTLTINDVNGNVSTCNANVTIVDLIPPSFTLVSANQNQNTNTGVCTYTKTDTNWDQAATDNCDVPLVQYTLTGATTGTGSSLAGVAFNKGVTTLTWSATDASGNSVTTSEYTITVTDIEPPVAIAKTVNAELLRDGTVIVLPSEINNASTDNCGIVTYEISRDNINFGTEALFTCTDIGSNTVYLRVTDEAGNTHVESTSVTVDDTQAPTLDDLSDRNEVVDADVCTYTHADTSWDPTDNCDLAPTITYTLSGETTVVTAPNTTLNGQVFEKGTTTVTWTVADHSSPVNSGTVTFNVIITDTQNPTISCPANIVQDVASAGDLSVVVSGITAPTYADNCAVTQVTYELSGATIAAAQASGINELSSATFNLGTTTVTYIAYDEAGNTETCNFTITVNALPLDAVTVTGGPITTYEDITPTATFSVVLPVAPTGTVVFDVTSSDTTEGTVDKSQLTFNASNWDTPQVVTVTGVNDDVDDDDIAYTIIIETNQGLTDDLSGYENANPDDISATNIDNDIAGFTVSSISGPTTEAGGTATFTVVLDTEPTEDVTITISSNDITESDTFSPTTLTFTAANWNTPQTVTATGKDDDIVDGNVTYNIVTSNASSIDPKYDGLVVDDVSIVNNDNDTAGFIVTPTTLTTSEAGTSATFTIVLTSKPGTDLDLTQEVVVDVASSNTNEGTVDLSQLTFTSANWNIPQTITITGVDESIVDGTIAYTIENTVNAASTTDPNYDPLNPADVAVNNTDNDAAFVSIDSVTQLETNTGANNFVFTITHSGDEVAGGYGVSFFTSNGIAKAPTDFTGSGGTRNFTTGAIGETQTIIIAINGDTAVERNETFSVVLNTVIAPGKNITIIPAGKTGIGTITNDDNATLSIADESILEGDSGTKTLTFTVTLDRAVEDGLSINYTTADATATTANTDYVATSGTLVFIGNEGETKTIAVTINGDEIVELDETFLVNLSNIVSVSAPGVAISFADDSALGTITNDDSAVISIAGFTVNEATATANFTIAMDKSVQSAFTIDFATSDDSALSGSDYTAITSTLNFGGANALTQTVTIPITNDSFVEPSEDLLGTISNIVDAANQSITFFGGGASTQATGTITDNDSANIAINDVSVNEADGNAIFTVTLTGDIQDDLTVDYATGNIDALAGSDYTTTSGTLTFVGGSLSGSTLTITVPILNDVIAEPTETYNVNLSNLVSTGSASISDNQGLGTITDNDPLTLEIAGFTITETEATQTANFVVTSNIEAQEDIIVTFTTSNVSTTSGSDLTSQTTQSYTLTAGATSWNIPVSILGDLIAEPTETFTGTIALSNINGQQVTITTATATSTILDNDALEINLAGFTVTETDGTQIQNFVASTNIEAQYDIVLSFTTSNGTALDGNDYTAQTTTVVTILAGTTGVNIPVDILGDLITEPQELFTSAITLTNANAQQVSIGTSSATATINDNDPATLAVSAFTVNEDVGTADFTITLSRTVQNAFTVDFATSDIGTAIGNALAGSDYTAIPTTTLSFGAANPLVQTITITINDDDLVEPTETFIGTLSNLVANSQAVTIPTPTATATINDNDAASVVIDDITVAEDVASGTAVFTVTLTGHIQDALTVDFTTNDGAATNPAVQPSDYTLTSGTITFPAGSNSNTSTTNTQTITVPIIDNLITEPLNEFYTVDLSNIISTGTATIDDAQGLGTIVDDDPLNAITLTGFNVTETNGNVLHNFVATLDYIAQEPIIISFTTTNGTAVATDFTAQTTVEYTIPSNTLFVNIPVEVLGDLILEPQESFTGTIALVEDNDQQVTIGTATAIGVINDDDVAVISIAGFTEDEGVGTAEYSITSSAVIQNEVTVIFSTSNGSAVSGSDYTAIASTTLTFGGSNSNIQTVSVAITDDAIAEPTELFTGVLSALVNNGQLVTLSDGAITSAIGTITDNDAATLAINDISQVEVDGGSTVDYTFTVTHSGQTTDGPFTVNFTTTNAEAEAGLDYVAQSGTLIFSGATGETQTITITVNGDDILEPTETFTVDLSENDFGGRDITYTDDSGLGTIIDNDSTLLTILANDDAAAEPSNNGQFTVSLGLVSSTDTEVSYVISGTATATNDYTPLTGTVTIAAGSLSATINVLVVNDNILEDSETVTLTLNAITSGDADITIDTNNDEAIVTITDEDVAEVSITATDASASEPSNNGQFTVSLTNASDVATTVSYTIGGTATGGTDYTALSGTVTIPSGSTSATIDVAVLDDFVLESSETVIVTIDAITSGDADVSIDTNNDEATVTISDNDAASLSISDVNVTEGNSAVFTLTLTGEVQGGFTIDYATADATAEAGSDYTSNSNTLTFAGTDTESQTITVATTDDVLLELSETFEVNLSSISNALVNFDAQAIGTITDNDAAALTVSDITVTEGDNVVFTVTLTGAVQGGFSIDYATADGSAVVSDDYTTESGTLTFTGTSLESYAVTVATTEDAIAEAQESFTLNLSNITNTLVTYDAQAIGTITDDDTLTISIADNAITETEGVQSSNFLVTMSGEAQQDVVLSFATTAGTATAGSDYIAQTGVLVTIPSGSTSVNIPVTILGDIILEPTETFVGTIAINTVNGQPITIADASADYVITDNDAASIAIADVTVDEGAGTATFTVTLTGNVQDAFSVDYATSDVTAEAGSDYTATTNTLTFAAGSLSGSAQSFTVAITDDTTVEPTETYTVTLSGITGGLVTISDATATITIADNDASVVSVAATTQASEPGTDGLITLTLSNPVSVATTVT